MHLGLFSYDDSHAREEVTDCMIRAELLFTYVEKYDFSGMVHRSFNPQFKGFSSSTTKRDIIKKNQKKCNEVKTLVENYKEEFCLTSKMWTSGQHMSYLSLTVHYIDSDWNLNKQILSFKMVESPHTGITIGSVIVRNMNSSPTRYELYRK